MNINTVRHGRLDVRLEQEKQSHLEAQEHGCDLAKKWAEGDSSVTPSLPLCTLVIEIVDREEQVAPILHRPPETMESQSLRKLYDYVEFCTPTSKSCVLFLRTNHPFFGVFERDPEHWFPSASADTLVLGLRILPPLASRRPSVSLPEELLHMIFNEAKTVDENWRELMLSLALVCRAWSHPALDTMYNEFGLDREVSLSRLANTLEYYPALGEKIRFLSTSGLLQNNVDEPETSEEGYSEKSRAFFTILQTAKNITGLYSSGVHRVLAPDFVHTLWTCTNLREFESIGVLNPTPSFMYLPNVGDILRCLTHWPRLCRLILSNVPPAIASDDLPTSTCTITFVKLCILSLDLSHLRLLTTPWKSGLREAWLAGISNLTNEDLRMWLAEVGPTLERLRLHYTVSYSNPSIEGEYALDAMLPIMSNLVYLDLGGNVGSHLVLERFAPAGDAIPEHRYKLWIRKVSGLSPDQVLNALNTTAWTEIRTALLWNQRGEMSEEAQRIATRRNIRITNAKS